MGFAVTAVALAPLLQPLAQPTPLTRVAPASPPPTRSPIAPVTAPASAEAIMLQNAQPPEPPAGIEFDDVPFQDEAVLSDDIIRPDPTEP
jgi:hypothetical protein